eukprot:9392062-Pyramimonas_sp.AAC.1
MALVQLLMLSAMGDFAAAVQSLPGSCDAGFSSSLDVFADDLTLQVEAQLHFLQQMSVDVTKLSCESLTDLGLPIAKSKGILAGADVQMPTMVAGRLKKYGFRPQPWLEVLGLEVGAGKPCYGHALKRRMRKVGKRARHIKRLQALGAKFKK